ncbi:sin3b-related [Anaeramoeba flamelloides]|uniref:Sin3b-related n=1 Tax=Anaeramoeba flamelloides TaxID=1746091 RepID=A0AAV7Z1I7_9EUKA|nr:sin3b-related [Anaeramoeba flamelloides]
MTNKKFQKESRGDSKQLLGEQNSELQGAGSQSINQQFSLRQEYSNLILHSSINNGINFLISVQSLFKQDLKLMQQFTQLVNNFRLKTVSDSETLQIIRGLFQNSELLAKFEEFLSQTKKDMKQTNNQNLKNKIKQPKSIEDVAVKFIGKIKKRFNIKSPTYQLFVSKLNSFQRHQISLDKMCSDVSDLFKDHVDLIESFKNFLPNSSDYHIYNGILQKKNNNNNNNNNNHFDERIRDSDSEKDRKDEIHNHNEENNNLENSLDSDDFAEDVIYSKENNNNNNDNKNQNMYYYPDNSQKLKYKHKQKFEELKQEQINSDKFEMKNREQGKVKHQYKIDNISGKEIRSNEKDSRGNNFQRGREIEIEKEKLAWKKYEQREEFIGLAEEIDRIEIENTINSLNLQGFPKEKELFAQMKQILPTENYSHILRILSLYTSSLLLKNDLMILIEPFIHPERYSKLYNDFKQLIYYGNLNYQNWQDQVLIPIRELDFTKLQSIKGSYKYLPKGYHSLKSSGKTELEKSVLNVKWISIATGHEYTTSPPQELNPHEETLFYLEDQRHAVDISIGKNNQILRIIEQLLRNIKTFSKEELKNFTAESLLKNVHFLNRIYSLYGEDYELIMEGIKKKPMITLKILFQRFTEKDEKLKAILLKLNYIWSHVMNNNRNNYINYQNEMYKGKEGELLSKSYLLNKIHSKNVLKPNKLCGFEFKYSNNTIINYINEILLLSAKRYKHLQTIEGKILSYTDYLNISDYTEIQKLSIEETINQMIIGLITNFFNVFFNSWDFDKFQNKDKNQNQNQNKNQNNNNNNNKNKNKSKSKSKSNNNDGPNKNKQDDDNNDNSNKKNQDENSDDHYKIPKEKVMFVNDDFYIFFKLFQVLFKKISEIKNILNEKQEEIIRQLYLNEKYPNKKKIKTNYWNQSLLLNQLSADYSQDLFELFIHFFTHVLIGTIEEKLYINECLVLFSYSSYKYLGLFRICGSIIQNLIHLCSNQKNREIANLYYYQQNFENDKSELNFLTHFKLLFPNQNFIYRIVLQKKINNQKQIDVNEENEILKEILSGLSNQSINATMGVSGNGNNNKENQSKSNNNNNLNTISNKQLDQGIKYLKSKKLKHKFDYFFSIELIDKNEIETLKMILSQQINFRKFVHTKYISQFSHFNNHITKRQTPFLLRNMNKAIYFSNKTQRNSLFSNRNNNQNMRKSRIINNIYNIEIKNSLVLQSFNYYPYYRYSKNTEDWFYRKNSLTRAQNYNIFLKNNLLKKHWIN